MVQETSIDRRTSTYTSGPDALGCYGKFQPTTDVWRRRGWPESEGDPRRVVVKEGEGVAETTIEEEDHLGLGVLACPSDNNGWVGWASCWACRRLVVMIVPMDESIRVGRLVGCAAVLILLMGLNVSGD